MVIGWDVQYNPMLVLQYIDVVPMAKKQNMCIDKSSPQNHNQPLTVAHQMLQGSHKTTRALHSGAIPCI